MIPEAIMNPFSIDEQGKLFITTLIDESSANVY